MGPSRLTSETSEYALTETAVKYPLRLVARSGFFTSGPLASEWTTRSRGLSPKSETRRARKPSIVKSPTSRYRLFVRTSSGTCASSS